MFCWLLRYSILNILNQSLPFMHAEFIKTYRLQIELWLSVLSWKQFLNITPWYTVTFFSLKLVVKPDAIKIIGNHYQSELGASKTQRQNDAGVKLYNPTILFSQSILTSHANQ